MATRLLLVLLAAKFLLLWGRPVPASGWTPIALLWQDAAIVLVAYGLERVVKRTWASVTLYVVVALIVAANIPVMRVLSSPLTVPILRAARGAMSDSFRYHATAGNVGGFAVVVALAGALLGWGLWRQGRGSDGSIGSGRSIGALGKVCVFAACALVLLGPMAERRVDLGGLERNPVFALLRTSVPRVRAQSSDEDWRASPVAAPDATASSAIRAVADRRPAEVEDLSHLRGTAQGLNVLLIVLESTAAGYLHTYGASEDPTPNLTALARRSIVFENAYAVYPESIKGVVALLAARYPGFDVPAERHAGIMAPSLAQRLGEAGYQTALFHSGRFFYLGMAELLAGANFGLLEDAGAIGGNHASSFGIDEPAAVRRMLRWLDGVPREQRFFAVYLPIAGHHPYATTVPGPFSEQEEIGRYRNALHEGDQALGELLSGLRRRGLDRSTLIIVAGDHGEAFGQHAGNYGHNLAIYDENVRVPLLVSLPDAQRARRVTRTASLLDIAPTTLDLLGLTAPAAFQGESLLKGSQRMALFFTDYSLGLLGLRDGCLKAIHALETNRTRVFDLCRDPAERSDLAATMPERVVQYRARLRRWSAAQVARTR